MNIVDRYHEQICEMFMRTHPNVSRERVMQIIEQFTELNLKNIPCVMHNNIEHEELQTTVLDVFDWVETRQPIISGNGTFFKQHAECLSPTIKMLETLQTKRGDMKDEMYTHEKGSIMYINLNVGQGSIKVIMNADYGGSGTPLSAFYSVYIPPATTGTAKAITTTLICCLEFISDNDNVWAKLNGINELYDMIFIVLKTPTEGRELINDSYSVDEVLNRLVSRTNNVTANDIRYLKQFLGTLRPSELTKLMLAFNVRLVMKKYLNVSISRIMEYLKQHPVDFENITKESLRISGFGVKPPEEIAGELEYVKKIIVDNCVYPFMPNDNEVRAANMERIIVCVTDTDSLMVHFASFFEEFDLHNNNCTNETFRDKCILAAALGMRIFVEGVIPQMVSDIATGCNIKDKYYRDKFVFKNEFAFLAMALFAKKMYASSMFVQEGNPRDIHDIAVTGLSFKKRDSAEFLEPIMLNLYDKYVLTPKRVNVEGILNEVYTLRDTLGDVIDTDCSYHKVLSVKDIGAYDASKVLPAQMRGSIVWNNIMPDEEILPLDRVIVVPLSFKLLQEHEHDDYRIAEILRLSLIDNEKMKNDPVICLPEHYKKMPSWIQPAVDSEYAVDKLLMPCKQLLGLFDVCMYDTRGGMIPSRMMFM